MPSVQENILNVQFREQYFSFIKYLCYQSSVSANDSIVLINYLLLQERIQESISLF